VVARLATAGAELVCPHHVAEEPVADLPGRHIPLELRDRGATTAAMAGCEGVVHLAARAGGIAFQEASQADLFDFNHAVTGSVLAGSVAAGVRRVYLASSAVTYAPYPAEPIPETAPLLAPTDRPSGYAWSKISDEAVAGWYQRAGQVESVVGRFTNVYGPFPLDRPPNTVVHELITKALAAAPDGELEVWGDGSAIRSFIHVEDAAAAVVRILVAGEPGNAYNVDTGAAVSVAQLARTIRDAVDPRLELRFDASKPAGAPYRVLDAGRLASLGFTPEFSLEQGIADAVAGARASVT
jgi:GDP-L-fucose synthase